MTSPVIRRSPFAPASRLAPVQIAPDTDNTYLLHGVHEVHGARRWVCDNSMVITGAEPVIVLTGTIADARQWQPH
jgi:hypothetical protein